MAHGWLEEYHSHKTKIQEALTRDECFSTLAAALVWLLGQDAEVRFWPTPLPDIAFAAPLVAEAVQTKLFQTNAEETYIALPVIMDEALQGIVAISLNLALPPQQLALAMALTEMASGALKRLRSVDLQTFRQLVEYANVAIDVAALDGTITYANLAAAQFYGFETPAQMIGLPVGSLYHGNEEQRISRDVIMQSKTADGWSGDVTHKDINGNPLPARLAVFGLRDAQDRVNGFGAIIQNLGEQQRLLFSLKQQTRRLKAASTVARAGISQLDLDSLFVEVTSTIRSVYGLSLASILMLEDNNLRVKMCYSETGPILPHQVLYPLTEVSINSWAINKGLPVLVNDVDHDARFLYVEGMPLVASELAIPLRVGNRLIGTLDVQSDKINAFGQDDVEVLQGVADQLAAAINNAQLFEAERIQIKQQTALNVISHLLIDAANLDEVWHAIYDQVAGLFNVLTFFVIAYNPEEGTGQFVYLVDEGQEIDLPQPFPMAGISKVVVQSGAPAIFNNLPAQRPQLEDQGVEIHTIQGGNMANSWLGAPLRNRAGAVVGLISVQSAEIDAFTEGDLRLLTTMATQISLAMENARLINELSIAAEQLSERARRMEATYRVSTLLTSSLDKTYILNYAVEQVAKLFHVDYASVLLLEQNDERVRIAAEYPKMNFVGYVIDTTNLKMIEHLRHADYYDTEDIQAEDLPEAELYIVKQLEMKALLLVRMLSKGKLIGVMSFGTKERIRTFTSEEIDVALSLATQVALAVENSNLYTQALAANELKSQFLATMSHELRTPLNAIMGYTEMVISGIYGALSDKQKDRLNRVYSNASHLLDLINDVLDLAKIESGRLNLNLEPVSIGEALMRAVSNVAPQVEAKGLVLEAHIPPDLVDVWGDRVRVRQVITNLLSNAVKFTIQGSVTVNTASVVIKDGFCQTFDVAGRGLADGAYVLISIKDTGIGIAPENHALIFDAFRQVDGSAVREYEGTGLGLAITQQLVLMHGGRLWMNSALGEGSTFTMALPASAHQEGQSSTA
jgi:PAS domain S-box-containing protein